MVAEGLSDVAKSCRQGSLKEEQVTIPQNQKVKTTQIPSTAEYDHVIDP